jgi:ribosomal protein S21
VSKRRKSRNNYNVQVTLEECRGSAERMIKKFCNKVKKEKILEDFRERMTYEKPSVKRRREKIRRKKLLNN